MTQETVLTVAPGQRRVERSDVEDRIEWTLTATCRGTGAVKSRQYDDPTEQMTDHQRCSQARQLPLNRRTTVSKYQQSITSFT